MFTQQYLNDSFMIRKIIVAAVPAALVAVGMSLAISEPANACDSRDKWGACVINGFTFSVISGPSRGYFSSGGGGLFYDPRDTNTNTTSNTNQVYPNTNSKPAGMGF